MNVSVVAYEDLTVTFSWIDYGLFLAMLMLSVLIGLYFGCFGLQDTANEYLLGGKQMTAIPIGVSLVASNISGITLLGVPTDIYRFGVTYYIYSLMLIPMCFVLYYAFIPVFYNLQVVSAYEYFNYRFDRKIRLLSSGLYVLNSLLYLPIVVYIPALALAQATHISIHYITPLICGVCILYTTIGGLKAVVWTDTLQFVVMIGSIIGVLYHGTISIGGFDVLWQRATESKRLDLDFDVDPTKKDTVLATAIGTLVMGFCACGFSQSFVQKFLSMPTMQDIKKAMALFYFGMLMILTLVTGIGLAMYANYHQCDPFTAGKIKKHDQVLPFYVMEVASVIPGLAGLFLSGILSAALSTLSACMNSLSASIFEDFVSPYVPSDVGQKKISNILKLLVVLIGLISTLMVYVVEHLGAIVPMNFALSSITNGPMFGLFLLGMLFPIANTNGALYGTAASISIMTFIIGGAQIHQLKGNVFHESKPLSIAECNETFTIPTKRTEHITDDDVFVLFKITHYYYTILGALITIVVGVLVSYYTRKETDSKVNPETISPFVHWINRKFTRGGEKEFELRTTSLKETHTLLEQLQREEKVF